MANMSLEDLPRTRQEALAAGLKHYFTGVPCPKGHLEHRFSSTGGCRGCAGNSRDNWRKNNPEKTKESGRDWHRRNGERHRATARAWKARNPEKNREITQAWFAANPDYGREFQRNRREKNPDQFKAVMQAWRAANPDAVRAHGRNRRARKKGAEGKFSAQDIKRIREAQKDRCAYCRTPLKGEGELDHIVALVNGGSNWPRNLQFLCQPCNGSKHARDPVEFARSRGLLV